MRKDKKKNKHRSASSESGNNASKERKSKKDKSSKKKSKDNSSTSIGTSEDDVFNEYVKQRLGPLVEFDSENYKLRFTARNKFRTNIDKKQYTQEEKEKMVEQMKKDAEAHEKEKLARYERDIKDHEDTSNNKKPSGGYLKEMHKDAMKEGGRNLLGDNLNRGRFFHDKKLAKGD